MKIFKLIKIIVLLLFIFIAQTTLLLNAKAVTALGNIEDKQIDYSQNEEILEYKSEITINNDSTIDVVENITVRALNQQINRGIYFDYALIHRTNAGLKRKIEFDVKEILKNNKKEPYFFENIQNGVRVYIGDKNKILDPGIYSYTIKYRTEKQLLKYEEFDEFYYNIIGTNWAFPIKKATAIIKFPFGENRLKKVDIFTGERGSKDNNVNVKTVSLLNNSSTILVEAKSPLNAKEGMTAQIQFDSGLIEYTPTQHGNKRLIIDNLDILIGFWTLVILLIYYIYIWRKFGIDPKKGIVIPLFEPPKGFSPAEVRYLSKESSDNKALVAALVNLGVGGFIKITEEVDKKLLFDKKYFSVTKLIHDKQPESDIEQKLFHDLFANGSDRVLFLGSYDSHIASMVSLFNSNLKKKLDKTYFIRNYKFLIIGLAISVFYIGSLLLIYKEQESTFLSLFLGFFFGVGFFIPMSFFDKQYNIFFKILGITSLIIWYGVSIFITYLLKDQLDLYLLIIFAASIAIHIIFAYLIKAPTLEGSKLQTEIEGFKMYLETAEGEDLKLMNKSVPKTFELYQKYLPYAIALDVETQWTNKFDKELLKAQQLEGNNTLGWYAGATAFSSSSINSISSGITSSISSSSSSGGSSGGGGGSSGGGGW